MKIQSTRIAICALLLVSGCDSRQTTIIETSTTTIEAQTSQEETLITGWVDQKYQAIVDEQNIPALSIGIIYEGKQVGFLNYGTLNRQSAVNVDNRSIYQIASLSKTLTGIITQSLISDGNLDMEEPITSYLSEVLSEEANQRLDHITLEQILQHESGITDNDCYLYETRVEGQPWLDGYSRNQLISDINNIDTPETEGPNFQYTNCGYAVLGLILELVTGKDYEDLLTENVSSIYAMQDTVVNLSAAQQARLVVPYQKTDRSLPTQPSIMGMGTPGSAIYSSTHDLLNLQEQQLDAYRNYANSSNSNDLVLTEEKSAGIDGPGGINLYFGSGLIEFPHPEGTFYLHDGDADGFSSVYVFSPEHNVGLVMLTSSGGEWASGSLIETMFGVINRSYRENDLP